MPVDETVPWNSERVISDLAARLFTERLDMGEALDAVADAARRALGAQRATCYTSSPEGLVTSVHTTERDPLRRAWIEGVVGSGPADLPIWRRISSDPAPLLAVPDASRSGLIGADAAASLGVGAFLGLRLWDPAASAGDPDIGHLFVTWAEPGPIGERDRAIGLALAGLAAPAVATGRMHAATREALERAREALTRARAGEEAMARGQRVARMCTWTWSVGSGEIERSPQLMRMLGMTRPEELTLAGLVRRMHPDDRDGVMALCERAAVDGRPIACQFRLLHPDEGERVIDSQGEADVWDPSGRPLRYVGAMQDVTARVRAEEALRASEARNRALAGEQAALRRVATAVAMGAEPEAVFSLVASEAAELLGADESVVCRVDEGAGVVMGAWGPHAPALGARVPLDRGILAPVHVAGGPWGAIAVAFDLAAAADRDAGRRLSGFAELVGLVIANAEARRELAERAATDPLTGVANHRIFHERLRDEIERSRRHGRPLAVALFDLDHFKRVNDVHGHQAGDRVLIETASLLEDMARAGDLVARVGGEEFAWLMPEASALDAYAASERARAAVAARPGPGGARLTISVGVCDLEHATTATEIYALADGALYWAKAHGRDACYLYSPAVVKVLSAEERAEQLERSQALAALRALARAVDAKDPHTQRHSERVADLAAGLAEALGWAPERVALVHDAGLVHDVGKIGVPDAVLSKPGRLTAVEYEKVKEHAALGAEIAGEILTAEQAGWVRGHHERWDGGGYPDGLGGADIPEGARILAVADAVDVMTGSRSYKQAMPWADALRECRAHAGRQFDPRLVEALARLERPPARHPAPPASTSQPAPSR